MKDKARELRAAGRSLKEIASELNIAKSTASLWLRDMPLADVEYRRRLGQLKGSKVIQDRSRSQRLLFQEEGRAFARKNDPLHLKGCMLYWCEGAKSKNNISFANTDKDMIVLFKSFLDSYFQLGQDDYGLKVDCYLGEGISEDVVLDYWLTMLDLPKSCLRKSTFKQEDTADTYRKNRHKFGVCYLVVCNTRVVQHIFGAIQEYTGISKPEWLS